MAWWEVGLLAVPAVLLGVALVVLVVWVIMGRSDNRDEVLGRLDAAETRLASLESGRREVDLALDMRTCKDCGVRFSWRLTPGEEVVTHKGWSWLFSGYLPAYYCSSCADKLRATFGWFQGEGEEVKAKPPEHRRMYRVTLPCGEQPFVILLILTSRGARALAEQGWLLESAA